MMISASSPAFPKASDVKPVAVEPKLETADGEADEPARDEDETAIKNLPNQSYSYSYSLLFTGFHR
jgi:hypothetical protein